MQFSIFGVPFKCTKDMFTWEKIRSTCFISWAITWRFFILLALIFTIAYPVLSFLKKDSISTAHITLALVCSVLIFIAYYYIKHSVLYEISFKTMVRKHINEPTKPKFKSWGFWKPQLIALSILLLALTVQLTIFGLIAYSLFTKSHILEFLTLSATFLSGISFVMITLNHFILHSGIFGFEIEVKHEETSIILDKLPPLIERMKLSVRFLFTLIGMIIAVASYFNTTINIPFIFEPYVALIASSQSDSQLLIYTYYAFSFIVFLVPTILLGLYTQYDALYKVRYKSVTRMYTSLRSAPKLWSLRFWGTSLLTGIITLLVTMGLSMLIFLMFDEYELIDLAVYGISYFIALITVSISFIAFGAWGFVPVRRDNKATESNVKS